MQRDNSIGESNRMGCCENGVLNVESQTDRSHDELLILFRDAYNESF